MKPLSEQLADLSARTKQAEDDAATAKSEARTAVQARIEKLKEDSASRRTKLQEKTTSAKDSVSGHWSALQTHVKERVDSINADIAATKAEHAADRTERKA